MAAPGFGAGDERGELEAVAVDFGDATQVFNVGAASVGAYGNPAGIEEAARRWGSVPLADLAAPAAAHARAGVPTNAAQAYISAILEGIVHERMLREGEPFVDAELAETIERLGATARRPSTRGDIAAAVVAELEPRGGVLTAEDLARYEPVARDPARASLPRPRDPHQPAAERRRDAAGDGDGAAGAPYGRGAGRGRAGSRDGGRAEAAHA